ncbi:MAG TPA: hypothetical protein VGM17_01130 [Rhizomicrobium sp.]|jgi:hypothetical protein
MAVAMANENSVVVVEEEAGFGRRFDWSAVFAGTAIAIASIFFLLSLGSGVGLSLVSARGAVEPRFLTLGAIYFLAAQAFGLAIGGHFTGRLIGPAIENRRQEDFRAATHGLVVWGFAVLITAIMVLVSGWVAAGSASNIAAMSGGANATTQSVTPNVATYWADMLFRPSAGDQHASLAWVQYAQADSGTQTDAQPQQNPPEIQPMQSNLPNNGTAPANAPASSPPSNAQSAPAANSDDEAQPAPTRRSSVIEIPQNGSADQGQQGGGEINVPVQSGPRNVAADKAEVARILEVGMANGGTLSTYDKQRIASLIAADTDAGGEAMRRVNDAVATIHNNEMRTAEFARKALRNASLWIAFALLFGAIVTAMSAVSARWEDDAIAAGRREPA